MALLQRQQYNVGMCVCRAARPVRVFILQEHDWVGLMQSIILLYHATLSLFFKQRRRSQHPARARWRQPEAV